MSDNDIILEYYVRGKTVRISAMDPVTLTEVSVIAPYNLSREQMAQLAMRKLNYVLKKRSQSSSKPST